MRKFDSENASALPKTMMKDGTANILFLLSQAETSSALLIHLPAGELITLARTNSAIRADLHDFGPCPNVATEPSRVRPGLQIGHHDTARWKKLKANAPYECSSSTHTRGTDVKPCRYCSKLVCGACMARASFANPGEKTFQMRCRSFCDSCWTSGNRHKSQKITDDCKCHSSANEAQEKSNTGVAEAAKTCECTNRNDGWVCLECKNLQNRVWSTIYCFGEGCANVLDSAAERRKICMWCDRPLPITATRENPHVYKQKFVDAMAKEAARRQADTEEYARRRQKRLRMTRRELRGNEETFDDIPQYVRHLDTVNYTQLVGSDQVPTSEQVYDSKQGKWRYSLGFLLAFRTRCYAVPVPQGVRDVTRTEKNHSERSNKELFEEQEATRQRARAGHPDHSKLDEIQEDIMRMCFVEGKSLKKLQTSVFRDYDILETEGTFRTMTENWKLNNELKASKTRLSKQDRSRYWQDLGPASPRAQGGHDINTWVQSHSSDLVPHARVPELEYLSDGGIPERREGPEEVPPILTTLNSHSAPSQGPTRPFLRHTPSFAMRESLAVGTLFPRPIEGDANFHSAAGPSTADTSNIMNRLETGADDEIVTSAPSYPDISQDLETSNPTPEDNTPAVPEDLDEPITAQEALRQEWQTVLDSDLMDWDATDPEDLDMLLALQLSAQEEAESARNESRPDGRPPVYFA